MTPRSVLSLVILGALSSASSAQSITFDWKWNRASDPITTPAPAALLPGESARVWLDVSFSPPAGSLININGTAHILRGLAIFRVDLNALNLAYGTWNMTGTGFGGTPLSPFQNVNADNWGHRADTQPNPTAWNFLGVASWGAYNVGNGNLEFIEAGQVAGWTGGPPLAPDNHIIEIWRARFTPTDYEPRTISWQGRPAIHGGASFWAMPAAGGPTESHPFGPFNINYGTLDIPVIPAPSSLALLACCGIRAFRRHR